MSPFTSGLGDFSESNTGEYTGCVPLVLGGYLPLCGRGYALFCTRLCTSAGLQPSPHIPSASDTLDRSKILGDFSESNTGEYSGCEPLVLGVCLPLCGHGPTPISCPSAHFSCQVATKSSHHQPTVLSDRSQILGDFSESNNGEYTGRVPLLLGGCLPLCGHGPAPVSYLSAHLCRVGAKSLHPISLRYSQTDPKY